MYCTLEDLKKALPERILLQLTDDENEEQFVISPPNGAYSRVVSAITDADSMIDGYVSGRYTLPFPVVPQLIKQISVNLTICGLYERNHEAELPEAIISRRKAFIKTLESLQDGTIVLPGQEKEEPAQYLVSKTDADQEFPDSLLNQY